MQVDLSGQSAIVTGGALGIGRAIAAALAANGANVAIVDISPDTESAAAELQEIVAKGPVAGLRGDVSNAEEMARIVADVNERHGPVSILVNNAGVNTVRERRPIHQYAREDWDRILRIDLTGVYLTSQAAIPTMLAEGRGRIVNIASVAGLVPLRLQSAFVAAKAGVVNLSRSMALELGPSGILTNCIAPGSILTAGTRALFYDDSGAYSEKAASLLSHVPLGRPGSPEEIAHAALFLVAPEASYVNGAVLTVDGGWTAGYNRDW